MPSIEHELLVELIREHPDVVIELLRAAFGFDARGSLEVVSASENLTEVQPPERRADLVLVLRHHRSATPARAVVVEVQLRPDPRKRFTWPVYVTVLRARLSCPVTLVVVTLDAATARWSAEPIAIDESGSTLWPLVIGPAVLPTLDVERARRHPELALLSLLAHRDEPIALGLARSLMLALDDVDDARAAWYADVVLSYIDDALRSALEAEMNPDNREFRSEFMRRVVARGEVDAMVRAIVTVLETRGLPVDEQQQARISACADRMQLEAWLVRAVGVTDTDALFDGD